MNLKSVLETIKPKILELGDEVYSRWGELKVDYIHADNVDISTNFDEYISKKLVSFLKEKFPDIVIYDEEFNKGDNYNDEYSWSIDPIDGTKYFAKQMPIWGVQIALLHKREPILGLIYIPTTKQYYYGYEGGGAFQNDKLLNKPKIVPPELATIVCDLVINKQQYAQITNNSDPQSWQKFKEEKDNLLVQSLNKYYRVRLIGNGSLSFVGLANGLFQEYLCPIRTRDSFHDLAAGIAIVKQLGFDIQINQIDEIFESVAVRNI